MKEVETHNLKKQLDKSKPDLHVDFNVSAMAPAGEGDKDSIVMIAAQITNTGAPSVLKNILVVAQTADRTIEGKYIMPEKKRNLEGYWFNGSLGGEDTPVVVERSKLLIRYLSEPISTGGGGTGAYLVLLPGINNDAVIEAGTIFTLSFEDVYGKKYEFKKAMTGEIEPPPLNPRTLQKHQTTGKGRRIISKGVR